MGGYEWSLFIFLFLWHESISSSPAEEGFRDSQITLKTKLGIAKGLKISNHYQFRKIPYAEPPVNELRYKPPLKFSKWMDEVDATQFPEYCIQYNEIWKIVEGDEDCLYLNVFTPSINSTSLYPVMVYFHPGGFMFGRGSMYRGDYLADTGKVVVVVVQYRLGSFGFLNTEDDNSSGNMGLKDQLMALHWVQDNIRDYGGNSDAVTLFGTSAGGASVEYHILSEKSAGLFQRGISFSGSAVCPWSFHTDTLAQAKKLASLVGCKNVSSSDLIVKCLKQKDSKIIAGTHHKFKEWYRDPIAAFGPSIEHKSKEAFLTEHPLHLILKGRMNTVSWVTSFTTDEGHEHALGIIQSQKLLDDLNYNWEKILPIFLDYTKDPKKNVISEEVRNFYFGEKKIDSSSIRNLTNLYSDRMNFHCIVDSAVLHSLLHPVHLIHYDYKAEHSMVSFRGHHSDDFIANHMDDLQFSMKTAMFPEPKETTKDHEFFEEYLFDIVNFATSGESPYPDLNFMPSTQVYRYNNHKHDVQTISEEIWDRILFWRRMDLQEFKFPSRDEL